MKTSRLAREIREGRLSLSPNDPKRSSFAVFVEKKEYPVIRIASLTPNAIILVGPFDASRDLSDLIGDVEVEIQEHDEDGKVIDYVLVEGYGSRLYDRDEGGVTLRYVDIAIAEIVEEMTNVGGVA